MQRGKALRLYMRYCKYEDTQGPASVRRVFSNMEDTSPCVCTSDILKYEETQGLASVRVLKGRKAFARSSRNIKFRYWETQSLASVLFL